MKCTIVLGCALEYLVVGYFTCVVEVVTTIWDSILLRIGPSKSPSFYCKFLCLVDSSNVRTKPKVLFFYFCLITTLF